MEVAETNAVAHRAPRGDNTPEALQHLLAENARMRLEVWPALSPTKLTNHLNTSSR